MAALTTGLPLPTGARAGVRSAAPPGWIQSAPFDLAFFILAPLLTLPLVLGALHLHNAFALVGFVLAFAHYLSSFSFYFWDENQERHRQRWMAFFGGPVLITVVFWVLVTYRVPLVIQFILFFWNAVHVARQSCGILSIYRHRAGVFGTEHKTAANTAVLAVSLWLCLWNIETHAEVEPVLQAVSPRLPLVLWAGTGALALAAVGRALAGFRRRAREGCGPRLPELGVVRDRPRPVPPVPLDRGLGAGHLRDAAAPLRAVPRAHLAAAPPQVHARPRAPARRRGCSG